MYITAICFMYACWLLYTIEHNRTVCQSHVGPATATEKSGTCLNASKSLTPMTDHVSGNDLQYFSLRLLKGHFSIERRRS